MTQPFRTTRRVEFGDTDMAGIAHFANFFRYMEAAETDFLLARGLSVAWLATALAGAIAGAALGIAAVTLWSREWGVIEIIPRCSMPDFRQHSNRRQRQERPGPEAGSSSRQFERQRAHPSR